MLRRLVLAFAATTLVLASVPVVGSATSIAGPNGKIAFTSGRDATGSRRETRTTKARGSGSPTGRRALRFRSRRCPPGKKCGTASRTGRPTTRGSPMRRAETRTGIWILDLRTGSQTQFVAPAPETDRPTWSPDGTRIAYGSMGDLWVKEVAHRVRTGAAHEHGGIIEERPVWSPDGNTLYYSRGATAETQDLYRKTPVTAAGEEKLIIGTAEDDWQPSLSPDGKTLCYTRGPKSSAADTYLIPVTGGLEVPFADQRRAATSTASGPRTGPGSSTRAGTFGAGDLAQKDSSTGVTSAVPASWRVARHFDGNTDWATNFSPKCDDRSANVGVNGFVSIAALLHGPRLRVRQRTADARKDRRQRHRNRVRRRNTGRSARSTTARSSTRRRRTSKGRTRSPTRAKTTPRRRNRRP